MTLAIVDGVAQSIPTPGAAGPLPRSQVGFVSTDCPTFVVGNGFNYIATAFDCAILVTLNPLAVANSNSMQFVDLPTSGILAGKLYAVKNATGVASGVTVFVQNQVDGNTNYPLFAPGEGGTGDAGNGVILFYDGNGGYWVVGSF